MMIPTRRQDVAFLRTQFCRRPLHAGMWLGITDALWVSPRHRFPLDRLRVLLCSHAAHHKAFDEVVKEYFTLDADGCVIEQEAA